MGGEHQCAVDRPVQRQQLGGAVGAFQRVVDVHRGRVFPHCLGAEGIAAAEPVAFAGDGVQSVALSGEGCRRLVHRRPADAQLLCQLLTGDISALCSRKCLQKCLPGGTSHGLSTPFVLYCGKCCIYCSMDRAKEKVKKVFAILQETGSAFRIKE